MKRLDFTRLAVCLTWCTAVLAALPARADDSPVGQRGAAEHETLFVRRIAPLLVAKCAACHGTDPNAIEGGLSLATHAAALRGGDSGTAAVVPGDGGQNRRVADDRRLGPGAAPTKGGSRHVAGFLGVRLDREMASRPRRLADLDIRTDMIMFRISSQMRSSRPPQADSVHKVVITDFIAHLAWYHHAYARPSARAASVLLLTPAASR